MTCCCVPTSLPRYEHAVVCDCVLTSSATCDNVVAYYCVPTSHLTTLQPTNPTHVTMLMLWPINICIHRTSLPYNHTTPTQVRDNLEKSIAHYEATNERPLVYIQTGKVTEFPDDSTGMASESHSWKSFFQKLIAPERYGYENLDSLAYYTERLQELNSKVDGLDIFCVLVALYNRSITVVVVAVVVA